MIVDFAEVDPEGDSIHVTREQWSLLTYIDGQSSLLAVSQRMGQPELTVMRLASQLTVAGIVVVVGRAS
jgi:hypothetical protein